MNGGYTDKVEQLKLTQTELQTGFANETSNKWAEFGSPDSVKLPARMGYFGIVQIDSCFSLIVGGYDADSKEALTALSQILIFDNTPNLQPMCIASKMVSHFLIGCQCVIHS